MTDVAEPLLTVGRDCDCGHPLVWRHGHPWCAVYGSHPTPDGHPITYRDRRAPLAHVVDELAAMPSDARRTVDARERRLRVVKA